MKILVVEDELEMLESIERVLKQEKAVVEKATNLKDALDKALIYEYDCILLDINLPDGSGLELLQELKKQNKSDGILIISARNSLDDKLEGLNLGADDYLTKPFHFSELVARVRSIVRRKKFDGNAMLEIGNICVDITNQAVTVKNAPVSLNRKEFAILMYLISNKGRLISKTALAEHVWGDNIDESDNFEFIYSQIKNLRKKMNDLDSGIEIQSIYGVGYKLIES
ncbi:response regulator transcription factor [uncultured Fluviicola sp.]|uniref:response regulator transcription factor n=1 Tax=uncultured Fluviicola sp. TaxID=463303 RepID=UPI0025D61C20|nr:response regulator transcription factor [uncultured Fluviicola sp.]